ncbi:MAG: asparaginase [Rhodobacteraceae bacterium]|nr:asparaginase [Paracoccaceae bacterium]
MNQAVPMVEVWRGEFLESLHRGHAVVCDEKGAIVQSWGDPGKVILPRSSCKMLQALPLIESGAADAFGLTTEQLALACASHQGAAIHTTRVQNWLGDLGLGDADLRCGPQVPNDPDARDAVFRNHDKPCQWHNNCSGKHTGFLTLSRYLGGGPEYLDIGHPVQLAVREAFESVTGEASPGYGIDGCSAPNFATTVHGLARAMARFASADDSTARGRAMQRLTAAMTAHPDLVAGEKRACTELMRAMDGQVAIKTGAEAVFVAILPQQRLGVALKIEDGASRASECAIAEILVRLGALDPDHPMTLRRRNAPILNRRQITTGYIRPSPASF